MNDIIKLLNIEDENIIVTDIVTEGNEKRICIETEPHAHYCPACGARMYSRGTKVRTIRHSILQDGYNLVILLKQRRWRCTNPCCMRDEPESFKFVSRCKQTSNITDMLVVEQFRNIEETAASVARKFNISDHLAMEIFERYVDMKRLHLTEIVSVDEVYMDMDQNCKYVLVIQDFKTGEPIDLVISRRSAVTEPYFMSIPRQERARVKYLISDMYNPYLAYVDKYFPEAVPVVDSFHVIQWIIHRLDMFLIKLMKNYKKRDEEKANELSAEKGRPVALPVSDEVYLLQHCKWVLLKNCDDINYQLPSKRDRHFGYYMDTYAYESRFLALHPDINGLRQLKEEYVHFNKRNAGNPSAAATELNNLIDLYLGCGFEIFVEFGNLLSKYRQPIINSFILSEKAGGCGFSRLSNGPIESMNRKMKDMKRNCRGFINFNNMRNRFLFANRNCAPITMIESDYPRRKENDQPHETRS